MRSAIGQFRSCYVTFGAHNLKMIPRQPVCNTHWEGGHKFENASHSGLKGCVVAEPSAALVGNFGQTRLPRRSSGQKTYGVRFSDVRVIALPVVPKLNSVYRIRSKDANP